MIPETQRITWPDNLRALATLAVVVLHVSSSVLYEFEKVSAFDWWTGNIYDSLVRWCVPIFLMVTGALLIPKQDTFSEFLHKRFGKIFLPFAFWSFIYLILLLYKHVMYGNEMGTLNILQIFYRGSSYHLWYIYMLLGVYIILPLISKKTQTLNDKNIIYLLLVWLLILGLNYIPDFRLKPAVHVFIGYVGYTILGYYLSKKNIHSAIGIVLFLIGILITALGTFELSNQQHHFNDLLYSYTTPHIALMAAGIFILIKNASVIARRNDEAISQSSPIEIASSPKHTANASFLAMKVKNIIAQHSLGIYLIHVLILEILNSFGLDWYFVNPLVGIPLTAFFCLAISTTVVYYSSKSSVGRYIFG